MNLASSVPLQNKLRKRKQVQKERRKFMKGLVLVLIIALMAIATGCARSAAIASDAPQPSLAPRADDSTKIFLPVIESAATDTEAALVASTPSIAPTDTATPTSTPTSTSTPPPEPTTIPTVTPVITTGASEYFPKISLGKLPAGPRPEKWWVSITPASYISDQEEICISFNNAKEFESVSYGIYNADKQEYAKPKTIFPQNGKIMRGYSNCLGRLPFSGKSQYELRVWVGDDLAAALPFEVTFNAATPTPWPTATKVPQVIVASPPSPPGPTSPLKVPSTGFALPVSSMNKEAEVEPSIASYVKAIYAYRVQSEEPNLIVSMRVYNIALADISGMTTQICLTNASYSHCYSPQSSSFSAGDPIRSILIDTNYSVVFDENIKEYGTDWEIKIKILSVVLKATK